MRARWESISRRYSYPPSWCDAGATFLQAAQWRWLKRRGLRCQLAAGLGKLATDFRGDTTVGNLNVYQENKQSAPIRRDHRG